jgi:uncharacterized protein YqhQ
MSQTFSYGGQALLEGVMIRAKTCAAMAVRRPNGDIVNRREELGSILNSRFAKLPFMRGVFVLWETLVVGTKALMFSANVQAEAEGEELSRSAVVTTMVISLSIAIAVFFLGPTLLAAWLQEHIPALFVHLIENGIQLTILVGYMWLIGRTAEVRRVFQYHGAEHMTIHAHEHGDPLTVDAIRKYPTAHPRCGTAFLFLVFIVAVIAFSLVGTPPLEIRILSRIILVPVIAGISYEILKLGARFESNPIMRLLIMPGIWLQMLTTKQPDDQQIEVAIAAMNEALAADGQPVRGGEAAA